MTVWLKHFLDPIQYFLMRNAGVNSRWTSIPTTIAPAGNAVQYPYAFLGVIKSLEVPLNKLESSSLPWWLHAKGPPESPWQVSKPPFSNPAQSCVLSGTAPFSHLLHFKNQITNSFILRTFLLSTTGSTCWFSMLSSAVPWVRPNPEIIHRTSDFKIGSDFCGKQIGETYWLNLSGDARIKRAASA